MQTLVRSCAIIPSWLHENALSDIFTSSKFLSSFALPTSFHSLSASRTPHFRSCGILASFAAPVPCSGAPRCSTSHSWPSEACCRLTSPCQNALHSLVSYLNPKFLDLEPGTPKPQQKRLYIRDLTETAVLRASMEHYPVKLLLCFGKLDMNLNKVCRGYTGDFYFGKGVNTLRPKQYFWLTHWILDQYLQNKHSYFTEKSPEGHSPASVS